MLLFEPFFALYSHASKEEDGDRCSFKTPGWNTCCSWITRKVWYKTIRIWSLKRNMRHQRWWITRSGKFCKLSRYLAKRNGRWNWHFYNVDGVIRPSVRPPAHPPTQPPINPDFPPAPLSKVEVLSVCKICKKCLTCNTQHCSGREIHFPHPNHKVSSQRSWVELRFFWSLSNSAFFI